VAGAGLPGAAEVAGAKWIEVKQLQNQERLQAAQERHPLGVGELSTILLAKEIHADTVLLDDYRARTLAKGEGLQVRGSVGVLETFYLRGHLPDLRAAFRQLLALQALLATRHLPGLTRYCAIVSCAKRKPEGSDCSAVSMSGGSSREETPRMWPPFQGNLQKQKPAVPPARRQLSHLAVPARKRCQKR